MDTSSSPLMRLPRELRDGIYEALLEPRDNSSNTVVDYFKRGHDSDRFTMCAVLLVNKTFHDEFQAMLARKAIHRCYFIHLVGADSQLCRVPNFHLPFTVRKIHLTCVILYQTDHWRDKDTADFGSSPQLGDMLSDLAQCTALTDFSCRLTFNVGQYAGTWHHVADPCGEVAQTLRTLPLLVRYGLEFCMKSERRTRVSHSRRLARLYFAEREDAETKWCGEQGEVYELTEGRESGSEHRQKISDRCTKFLRNALPMPVYSEFVSRT